MTFCEYFEKRPDQKNNGFDWFVNVVYMNGVLIAKPGISGAGLAMRFPNFPGPMLGFVFVCRGVCWVSFLCTGAYAGPFLCAGAYAGLHLYDWGLCWA